ncbi:MAG: abortive infection family protein [Chloroflexi bacterium]|nr:abortive infection family protein [Chloroflexota bacterium]MYE41418.1 abortive infection family protein [Chloroflexota bacterium]
MDSQIEEVESLQNLLVAVATGRAWDEYEYGELRRSLMGNTDISEKLPRFVKTNRDTAQFWNFIKQKFSTYQERREFLWEEFRPLLDWLENQDDAPSHVAISEALQDFDANNIQRDWVKALDRLNGDAEGAITSARTLLESVCKHILEQTETPYEDDLDLPALYRKTSLQLNLAPEQHSEQIFKQILGGCTSITNGLAGLRNRLGDAHGQGSNRVRPARRHAELAVNVAGAMAVFLVETWNANKTKSEE